ncbi:glycosyltransferase [Flammeovirga sp. OC4]|uniref:glycosyltransferase n=1 Tax=Flammeovirga sp. OC4 TaxID=1382345 RepID=UPI0005C4F857|nr:glycosyltransferase [Flammeovirga sp. OC4]
MNILHIFNEINVSGAELMYLDAAEELKKSNKLFALSSGKYEGELYRKYQEKGYKTYHLHYKNPNIVFSLSGLAFYIQLFRILKEQQINVVHIHKSTIYFPAVICFFLNIKCIKSQHNVFNNRPLTKILAIIRRFIIRFFFNAKFHSISKSVYENEKNNYHNRTYYIPNWVNKNNFKPANDKKEVINLRNQLGINYDDFVLITIGRCVPEKQHDHIIHAVHELKSKIPNIKLLHLGSGICEKDEIELSKQLNVHNEILFLGNKNNVRDYLIASDALIMPSKFEGLGNVVIESMYCKIPTILYNSHGLRDFIQKNDNGLLINPDIESLKNAIFQLFSNEKLRVQLSNNAYHFVQSEFNMEKSLINLLKLYRQK